MNPDYIFIESLAKAALEEVFESLAA